MDLQKKNRIIGFIEKNQMSDLSKVLRDSGFGSDDFNFFTRAEFESFRTPSENNGSFVQTLSRFFDKIIGEANKEFFESGEHYIKHPNYALFDVVVTSKEQKQKAEKILDQFAVKNVKYFHSMYTEHLSDDRPPSQDSPRDRRKDNPIGAANDN